MSRYHALQTVFGTRIPLQKRCPCKGRLGLRFGNTIAESSSRGFWPLSLKWYSVFEWYSSVFGTACIRVVFGIPPLRGIPLPIPVLDTVQRGEWYRRKATSPSRNANSDLSRSRSAFGLPLESLKSAVLRQITGRQTPKWAESEGGAA